MVAIHRVLAVAMKFLDPNRNRFEAGPFQELCLPVRGDARIDLDRDLGARLEGEPVGEGPPHALDLLQGEKRGRPPAPVILDEAGPAPEPGRPPPKFPPPNPHGGGPRPPPSGGGPVAAPP